MGISGVTKTKTTGNIGIFCCRVFFDRSLFIRYVFDTLHMDVEGGIVFIQVKVIKSIKSNQRMD